MNNQTKQVIDYCSDEWRLLTFCTDLERFNPRGIVEVAKGMTDELVDENDVDWVKVEDVLYWKIEEKLQYSQPYE